MKKLIAALALSMVATSAFAHGYYGGYRGGYGGYHGGYHGADFVAPALIGGVIGYALAQPHYVAPPPTVIYQQPGYVPAVPYGYHYEMVLDAHCNCYRNVLVPN